jgi:hypothetical protein
MFNLKKEETISKTIRIPAELVYTLEKLADEKELSLSKVIIQCCEYALENLESQK